MQLINETTPKVVPIVSISSRNYQTDFELEPINKNVEQSTFNDTDKEEEEEDKSKNNQFR